MWNVIYSYLPIAIPFISAWIGYLIWLKLDIPTLKNLDKG